MRRALAVLLTLVMIGMFVIPVGASTAVSVDFVPRTPKGTIFYLDICSDTGIAAAVFELSYDGDVVEYRDVSAEGEASVQALEEDGVIRIAYGHPTGGSGKLLRLTFNALTNAETSFTLHVSQAVDAEISYLTDIPDYLLRADVGRQTVVSSGAVKSTGKTEKSTGKTEKTSKNTSSRSTKTGGNDSEDSHDDTVYRSQRLANRDAGRWFLIGACSVIGILLVIAAAFFIGRRFGLKAKKSSAEQTADHAGTEEPAENNSDTEQ